MPCDSIKRRICTKRPGQGSRTLKRDLIRKVTDVVVEVEGFPAIRPSVHVLIEEIPAGGYGIGGRALDVEKAKAALAAASTDKTS